MVGYFLQKIAILTSLNSQFVDESWANIFRQSNVLQAHSC